MAIIWAEILKFIVSISWRTWLHLAMYLLVFVGGCTLGCQCAKGADSPKENTLEQRVTALSIKVELLQRQVDDFRFALGEIEKRLPGKPAAKPAVFRTDEPKSCPVNGSQCPCGCRSGKPCNCALSREAPVRLSRLDPQEQMYFQLLTWLVVGEEFYVLVGPDAPSPPPYRAWVRWDKYPGVTGSCLIKGVIKADGKPYEEMRQYPQAPVVQYLPFAPFGGVCRSCR